MRANLAIARSNNTQPALLVCWRGLVWSGIGRVDRCTLNRLDFPAWRRLCGSHLGSRSAVPASATAGGVPAPLGAGRKLAARWCVTRLARCTPTPPPSGSSGQIAAHRGPGLRIGALFHRLLRMLQVGRVRRLALSARGRQCGRHRPDPIARRIVGRV